MHVIGRIFAHHLGRENFFIPSGGLQIAMALIGHQQKSMRRRLEQPLYGDIRLRDVMLDHCSAPVLSLAC
jgi:hypothetical protein